MTFETLFPYLLPPVLGAVIGYVTNYVAIRMLFRPLKEWRLFGLRVPMTPGIIPSRRRELAARMGEMVGSHLLTPEDVSRTLEREAFRRELKLTVAEKLTRILERDLGTVAALVPRPFAARFAGLVDAAGDRLAGLIVDYLRSEAFAERLNDFVRPRIDGALALDLERVVSPGQYDQARHHVDTLLGAYLASDPLAESVGHFVDDKTAHWFRSDRPLRSLLPADLVVILLDQLEKEVPPLLEKFGGLLYDPEFRQRLTVSIRQGVEKFLDSLGGLAGLLSGFIDLDKVYAKIPDTLDQVSEEAARWLREEKTRAQIAGLLRERVEGFLDRPLAEYIDKLPYDKVDGVRQFLRNRAIETLRSRRTAEMLVGLFDRGVRSVKNRSFGSVLDAVLPENGRERGVDLVEAKLLALLRSEAFAASIHDIARRQLRQLLFDKPLGRLATRIPADVNVELEEFFCQQLIEVLQKEIPVLVDTLNIRQMVEDKVNGLDLLEVENLLLGVMQEQFKYINLFGALLGFLIGLINVAALLLGRM